MPNQKRNSIVLEFEELSPRRRNPDQLRRSMINMVSPNESIQSQQPTFNLSRDNQFLSVQSNEGFEANKSRRSTVRSQEQFQQQSNIPQNQTGWQGDNTNVQEIYQDAFEANKTRRSTLRPQDQFQQQQSNFPQNQTVWQGENPNVQEIHQEGFETNKSRRHTIRNQDQVQKQGTLPQNQTSFQGDNHGHLQDPQNFNNQMQSQSKSPETFNAHIRRTLDNRHPERQLPDGNKNYPPMTPNQHTHHNQHTTNPLGGLLQDPNHGQGMHVQGRNSIITPEVTRGRQMNDDTQQFQQQQFQQHPDQGGQIPFSAFKEAQMQSRTNDFPSNNVSGPSTQRHPTPTEKFNPNLMKRSRGSSQEDIDNQHRNSGYQEPNRIEIQQNYNPQSQNLPVIRIVQQDSNPGPFESRQFESSIEQSSALDSFNPQLKKRGHRPDHPQDSMSTGIQSPGMQSSKLGSPSGQGYLFSQDQGSSVQNYNDSLAESTNRSRGNNNINPRMSQRNTLIQEKLQQVIPSQGGSDQQGFNPNINRRSEPFANMVKQGNKYISSIASPNQSIQEQFDPEFQHNQTLQREGSPSKQYYMQPASHRDRQSVMEPNNLSTIYQQPEFSSPQQSTVQLFNSGEQFFDPRDQRYTEFEQQANPDLESSKRKSRIGNQRHPTPNYTEQQSYQQDPYQGGKGDQSSYYSDSNQVPLKGQPKNNSDEFYGSGQSFSPNRSKSAARQQLYDPQQQYYQEQNPQQQYQQQQLNQYQQQNYQQPQNDHQQQYQQIQQYDPQLQQETQKKQRHPHQYQQASQHQQQQQQQQQQYNQQPQLGYQQQKQQQLYQQEQQQQQYYQPHQKSQKQQQYQQYNPQQNPQGRLQQNQQYPEDQNIFHGDKDYYDDQTMYQTPQTQQYYSDQFYSPNRSKSQPNLQYENPSLSPNRSQSQNQVRQIQQYQNQSFYSSQSQSPERRQDHHPQKNNYIYYDDQQYSPNKNPQNQDSQYQQYQQYTNNPYSNRSTQGQRFNPNDSKDSGNRSLPYVSLNMSVSDQNALDNNSKNQSRNYSPSRPYTANDPRYMEGNMSREGDELRVRHNMGEEEAEIEQPDRPKKSGRHGNRVGSNNPQDEDGENKLDTSIELNLTDGDDIHIREQGNKSGNRLPHISTNMDRHHQPISNLGSKSDSRQYIHSLQSQPSLQDQAFEIGPKYPTFKDESVAPIPESLADIRSNNTTPEKELPNIPPNVRAMTRQISFGFEFNMPHTSSSKNNSPPENSPKSSKGTTEFPKASPQFPKGESERSSLNKSHTTAKTAAFLDESPMQIQPSTGKKQRPPNQQSFADANFILPPKPQEGDVYSPIRDYYDQEPSSQEHIDPRYYQSVQQPQQEYYDPNLQRSKKPSSKKDNYNQPIDNIFENNQQYQYQEEDPNQYNMRSAQKAKRAGNNAQPQQEFIDNTNRGSFEPRVQSQGGSQGSLENPSNQGIRDPTHHRNNPNMNPFIANNQGMEYQDPQATVPTTTYESMTYPTGGPTNPSTYPDEQYDPSYMDQNMHDQYSEDRYNQQRENLGIQSRDVAYDQGNQFEDSRAKNQMNLLKKPAMQQIKMFQSDPHHEGILEVPRSQESSDFESARRSGQFSDHKELSEPGSQNQLEDLLSGRTHHKKTSEDEAPPVPEEDNEETERERISPENNTIESEEKKRPDEHMFIKRSKSAIEPREAPTVSGSPSQENLLGNKVTSLDLDLVNQLDAESIGNLEDKSPNSKWKALQKNVPFQRGSKKRLSIYHEEIEDSPEKQENSENNSAEVTRSKQRKSSRVHIFLGGKNKKKKKGSENSLDNSRNQEILQSLDQDQDQDQEDEHERAKRAGRRFSTLKLESQETSPIGSPHQSQIIQGNPRDYQFNSRGSEPDDTKNRSNLLVSPIEKHQSFAGDYSVQANEFDYDEGDTMKIVRSPVRNNQNRSDRHPTPPKLADSSDRRYSDEHTQIKGTITIIEANKLPSAFSSFDDKTHRSQLIHNVTPEISPSKHNNSEAKRSKALEIDTEDVTGTDNNLADPLMTFDRKKDNKTHVIPDEPAEKDNKRRDTLALASHIQSLRSSEIQSANKNSFDSISEIAKGDGRFSHISQGGHWKSNVSDFEVVPSAISTDRAHYKPNHEHDFMKRPSLENLQRAQSKHRFIPNEEPIAEDEEREREDELFDVTLKQNHKDKDNYLNSSFRDDDFMNESSGFRKYIVPKPNTNTTSRSKLDIADVSTSKRNISSRSHASSKNHTSNMRIGLGRDQLIEKELECIEYINDKRYLEAIAKLLDLLKLACLSPKDPHSIYLNYLIAECYSKMGQPDKAEVSCVRTLQTIEENHPITDKYVFLYYYGFLTLLGSLNMSAKRHKEAFLIYEKILEVLTNEEEDASHEVKLERAHLQEELPVVQYNMATCLLNMDQYERAIYFYKESSDNLIKRDDKSSIKRLISCYKKLAICFERLNMQKEAIIYYRKALEEILQNDGLSEDLRTLIFIYDQLGQLFNDIKSFKEAIYCYGEGLRLKIEYYGLEKEPVGHGFISLAKAYMSNKEYLKAYGNFESGNHILEVVYGRFTIHTANCYVCMAQIKHRLKEYSDSFNLYEAALDVYSNLLGKNHLYTYRIHLNLLYLAFVIKDEYKLISLEKRLLSHLENYIDLNAFIIYNEAANIFRKNKDYNRALNYYYHSIELFDMLPDKEIHYDGLSLVYCNVASTNLLKKSFHEAIRFYKIALKVSESSDKADQRKAQINTNIGKIYKTIKSKRDALIHLQEAEILFLRIGKTSKSRKMQDLRKLMDEVQRMK